MTSTLMLTGEEFQTVNQAMHDGWLVRSGKRVVVLLEYKARCRGRSILPMIVQMGVRKACITIEGHEAWSGSPEDAEAEAARIAQNRAYGGLTQ